MTGPSNSTHIVNLIVKIILHQFDIPKKKANKDLLMPPKDLESNIPDMASGNNHDKAEEDSYFKELARVLDKEVKEMDEADKEDNEESDTLVRDVEKIEDAMEEEIK